MTEQSFWLVQAFLFGTIIGSFLNVVIVRLPLNEDVVFKSSHCPKCKNQIRWFMNIPILSYIFLRGQCYFCDQKISLRYPLVELVTGLMCYYLFPSDFGLDNMIQFFILFFGFCILLCHFFIDIDHKILPDSLNLLLLIQFLSYSIYFYSWKHWLIGCAIGFLGTLLITWLFYLIKGQVGLGGGDIKLFGILGLVLGPIGILQNIFLSCFIGAVFSLVLIAMKKMKRTDAIAFGPFIILVAVWQIYFSPWFPDTLFKIQ